MAISRRWWEPEAQDMSNGHGGEACPSMDLGDLMSLAMNGGEFSSSQFAALLRWAECDRQPTTHVFPQVVPSGASVWSGIQRFMNDPGSMDQHECVR